MFKIKFRDLKNRFKANKHQVRPMFSWVQKRKKIDCQLHDVGGVKILTNDSQEKEMTLTNEAYSTNRLRIELEHVLTSLESQMCNLADAVKDYAYSSNILQAKATLDTLLRLVEVKQIISKALASLTEGKATSVYIIGSWFLHDCFHYLVKANTEALHFVSGVQFGNIFTLDKMITFAMSCQTVISASGDITATHKALIQMESYGHRLHACFHSHPGKGPAATFPSSIDLDYQARLEKGGYGAIGGIFSRDGCFRTFSLERPFKIEIYGKGVKKIDDRTYCLVGID